MSAQKHTRLNAAVLCLALLSGRAPAVSVQAGGSDLSSQASIYNPAGSETRSKAVQRIHLCLLWLLV